MNMTVIEKDSNKKYQVYDIAYNKNGYPHFLIYREGQWVRISAKHFKPQTADDIIDEMLDELKNTNIFKLSVD